MIIENKNVSNGAAVMSSLTPGNTAADEDISKKPKPSIGGISIFERIPDEYDHHDDAFQKYYQRKPWFVLLIRSCCAISVLSVCLNTPQSFKRYPSLRPVTLSLDCITGLVLIWEVTIKVISKGFIMGRGAYLKNRGHLFEFLMTLCIVISIILQILEMAIDLDDKVSHYIMISAIRSVRPFLLLRVMKSMLQLRLPKTLPRSLKQIWGVLMFTAYFMTLAAFVGVQMFGLMKYYCVRDGASLTETKYSDLLIPTQRCSPESLNLKTYTCPENFTCSKIEFSRFRQDYRYFDTVLTGLLTVYETASLEGWSLIMYDTLDTRFFLYGVVYFICVVFFIAWLVRNVFIAIITEAFADLRLQVNKLSQTSSRSTANEFQVLRKLDSEMLLVTENQLIPTNPMIKMAFRVCRFKLCKYFIILCVLVDALLQAFMPDDNSAKDIMQVFFVIFFDIEALVKIIGMGWSHYSSSFTCRFEFFLCIGSTIFLPLVLTGKKAFVVIQVLRFFRLLFIWTTFTNFVKRILGSGKKITSLLLFTVFMLIIAAGVALQLFCGICLPTNTSDSCENFKFGLFHLAIKSMFQVFMAEGWNAVMDEVLYAGGLGYAPLVFAVFILFHLFAATILLSVFVALILDNLESSEELKLLKQKKQGEEVADTENKLPARVRVFKQLKPRPKLVKVSSLDMNILPKVRQSFLSKYVHNADSDEFDTPLILKPTDAVGGNVNQNNALNDLQLSFVENQPIDNSFLTKLRKQSSVTALMQEANLKRVSIHSNFDFSSSRSKSFKRSISRRTERSPVFARPLSETAARNAKAQSALNFTAVSNIINQTKKLKDSRDDKKKGIGIDNRLKDIDVGLMQQRINEARLKKEAQIEELRENHPSFDKSLFIFSKNNWFRKMIIKIVEARYDAFHHQGDRNLQLGAFSIGRIKRYLGTQTYLDWGMLFFTQVSCLAMLVETPRLRPLDRTWMAVIEYAFVASTTIEIFLKVVANGLFFSPNAFIHDVGGVLHVLVYMVSVIYVTMRPETIPPGSASQILLALRALRPLRIITLAPQLRKVVAVLVRGFKDIFQVALLQIAVMFVFASYGVQTLSGKLKSCNDPTVTTKSDCYGTFLAKVALPNKLSGLKGNQTEILVPRVWRNPRNFNFDNMGSALLTLLEVLSLEGWTDVRDILEEKVGWEASIYPHVYIFIACLIGLTLFIGIIVNNFNENKGIALLTVEQKRWKDLKKKLELAQPLHMPSRPVDVARARLYDMFLSKKYHITYSFIIFINCGTLCFGQWQPIGNSGISEPLLIALVSVSMLCCVAFLIDTILKIIVFSFKGYWLSWRNRLDFFLAICGIGFCIWTGISCNGSFKADSCGHSRLFGVVIFTLRFLSLSGKHNLLRMLMLTVVMSLSKSFFTISVLLMIMACYAFVGVVMFGSVKHGLALNDKANFETSWNALLLTFRITTGEDWNKLMHDASIAPPYCKIKSNMNFWESNCGNRIAAFVFFHSYYVIITYIFLNLFIAVVIENFSIFYSTDDFEILSAQDIGQIQEKWNFVDRDKRGSVSVVKARVALVLLSGLFKNKEHALLLKRMCAELDRKKNNAKEVTFHNLLFVIAYKKIDIGKSLQLEERLTRIELESSILEDVASEIIRQWFVTLWRRRKENKSRGKLERRLSANSGNSYLSFESNNSDNDDIALSVGSAPANTQYQISSVSDSKLHPNYRNSGSPGGLRRRRSDVRREYKSEFYSWWDDEVEDNL